MEKHKQIKFKFSKTKKKIPVKNSRLYVMLQQTNDLN